MNPWRSDAGEKLHYPLVDACRLERASASFHFLDFQPAVLDPRQPCGRVKFPKACLGGGLFGALPLTELIKLILGKPELLFLRLHAINGQKVPYGAPQRLDLPLLRYRKSKPVAVASGAISKFGKMLLGLTLLFQLALGSKLKR